MFKPGEINNPKGAPKKKKERLQITLDMRIWLRKFLNRNRKTMQRDWDALTPFERLAMTERLLVYTMPKMNSLEIEALPESQLDGILQKLIAQDEKKQLQHSRN